MEFIDHRLVSDFHRPFTEHQVAVRKVELTALLSSNPRGMQAENDLVDDHVSNDIIRTTIGEVC
jgi:hypothetical protein